MVRYIPRLFTPQPLTAGQTVALSAPQHHYLTKVLRRRAGEAVRLFNGLHGEWQGALQPGKANTALITLEQQLLPQPIEVPLLLAFAPLRPPVMATLIAQATELGVTHLQPLSMAQGQPNPLNSSKLLSYAIEAAESSGRYSLPQLLPLLRLQDWLANPPMISPAADITPTSPILYGDERLTARPIANLLHGNLRPSGLLIGPEGGFSATEFDQFADTPWLHPCRLGARVMRAETAALIGLALITTHRDGIHQP